MYHAKRLLTSLIGFALFVASTAAVSAVTITSNTTYVQTTVSGGDVFNGLGIPATDLLDVTQGTFFSRNQIDYTGSGENVTMLNAFSQGRSGNSDDTSIVAGTINFTVDAGTNYSLSGAYNASHGAAAGQVYFYTHLLDQTAATMLFYNVQISQSTVSESFTLGGGGADYWNDTSGALTGSLIVGHQYQWYFQAYIQASNYDGGATADGFARLDIGGGAPSTSVPDGGTTLALLGLTVLSLGACRRKIARG